MNRDIKILALIILISFTGMAQVGIGTTSPDASAALDISSTDGGILFPRMTSAQREGIVNPATSLTVFDNDTNTFWSFVASTWIEAKPGVGKFIDGAAADIAYYPDRVGIGLDGFSTGHKLFVESIKDTDGSHAAVRINATYEGTGTATTTYGLGAVARNNSTATVDYAIGTQGIVENIPGGTINNAAGTWPQLSNNGTVVWGSGLVVETINNAGTINTGYGQNISITNKSGASMGQASLSSLFMTNESTVTGNAYGLWIGGTGSGSVGGDSYALYIATPFTNVAGNNFALYSENTADSYIEGNLGVGTTTPLQKVHINGVMRLQPQASAPTGGLGDFYVNSTDNKLYFHDGSGWREVQLVP